MKSFFRFNAVGWNPDLGLLLLRLIASSIMGYHGSEKLLHFTDYLGFFPDPIGLGVQLGLVLTIFAEVFCSALLVMGLFTRIALIPLIFTMLVAFFIIHAQDPFKTKELAFYFLGVYGMLMMTGPGKWSVDHLLNKK